MDKLIKLALPWSTFRNSKLINNGSNGYWHSGFKGVGWYLNGINSSMISVM